ncbi:hydroxyethylthiazole kinase [Desnuesiella massiliensis]|uniref:hydroxyethylthiazole kinase n=1 Tax=Desnuesiella massiliensis TaxID=1650662 RepID=UPI0006E1D7CD|nr:hydroxyethylthiazole kinase [Desnuesiella massiliensis]
METREKLSKLLTLVKEKKPLVHHITNYVTVNDCANITLSLGGSPVMADDSLEVEEMISIASSLVINIGTLNSRTIESMLLAGKRANSLDIPVILDPVGVGATNLRTETAKKLLKEINFSVIKGNMSEIKVLSGMDSIVRGVDSTEDTENGEEIALKLSQKLGSVIAITGAKDIISDGKNICFIENGHPILAKITGTGCMSSSLTGAYCGVTKDYYTATIAAIATMGLCGEMAEASLKSNYHLGSFKVALIDSIASLSPKDLFNGGKLNEHKL